jgi:hypothetical protein
LVRYVASLVILIVVESESTALRDFPPIACVGRDESIEILSRVPLCDDVEDGTALHAIFGPWMANELHMLGILHAQRAEVSLDLLRGEP